MLGAVVGSFLATLALRIPEDWPGLIAGRSACRHCGHILGAKDLVPILSYLARGGRCAHCGARIAPYYPLVETAAALFGAGAFAWLPPHQAVVAAGLGWWLLALALVDLRTMLLPDELTLPLLLLGIGVAALAGPLALPLRAPPLPDALIGAVAGFLGLAGVAWAYRTWRGREGLGLGDAKLLAAAGAWLGWQALPLVLLAAAGGTLALALLGRRDLRADTAVPLGPGLAGAFLAFYVGLVAG